MKPSLTFIFPIYNESRYLEKQVKTFVNLVSPITSNWEILLVENGSTDNSWKKILNLAKQDHRLVPLRIEHASYGRAVKHGLLAARGKIVVVLNIDFLPILFILESISLLKKQKILGVVGSKHLSKHDDKRGMARNFTSQAVHISVRFLTGYKGTDTHGVKTFKNGVQLKSTIHECYALHELFDTELIVRLAKKGRVVELPVEVKESRPTRYLKRRRLRNTFFDLYRIIGGKLGAKLVPVALSPTLQVAADDFGKTAIGNQAIIDLASVKGVTTVSVLASTPKKELSRVKKLQDTGTLVGLHFNLVYETSSAKHHRLTNKKRRFFSFPLLIIKLLSNTIDLKEVEQEFVSQLKRLQSNNLVVDYVDSEQHLHHLHPVSFVVRRLADQRRLSIRSRASTITHLYKKPLRLLIFLLVEKLLSIRYPAEQSSNAAPSKHKHYDAIITHPGLDYD